MYVPRFNTLDAGQLRALVAAVGSAELITVDRSGYPAATRLPVLWEDGRLLFHLARANPHWRSIDDGAPGLAVVTGAEAYVSPAWYPSKAEHGRVVPTWNYTAVQFLGRVSVHPEPDWLLDVVTRLTDQHERHRPAPWAVSDAPAGYIEQQLRAIVGVEFAIEAVEGKAKLSQNRSPADVAGVIDGLRREGGDREHAVAASMAEPRAASRAPGDDDREARAGQTLK